MLPKPQLLLLLILLSLFSACEIGQTATPVDVPPNPTEIPTSTPTDLPPTETPIPLAAIINGEEVLQEEFDAEVSRFISAQDEDAAADQAEAQRIVLEDIISQILLAQGADESGFVISEQELETRLAGLIDRAGGQETFDQWLQANNYTRDSLRKALERSIKAAWMRDQILDEVPESTQQVHIRQIFLLNSDQANQVLAELDSGRDFATVAAEIDPQTRGDLGWIPRHYLPHEAIEEAAFELQPGEYSQVIETSVGYHIIQVVEIDEDRRLAPDARLIWQELALYDWVDLRRESSNIEVLTLE